MPSALMGSFCARARVAAAARRGVGGANAAAAARTASAARAVRANACRLFMRVLAYLNATQCAGADLHPPVSGRQEQAGDRFSPASAR